MSPLSANTTDRDYSGTRCQPDFSGIFVPEIPGAPEDLSDRNRADFCGKNPGMFPEIRDEPGNFRDRYFSGKNLLKFAELREEPGTRPATDSSKSTPGKFPELREDPDDSCARHSSGYSRPKIPEESDGTNEQVPPSPHSRKIRKMVLQFTEWHVHLPDRIWNKLRRLRKICRARTVEDDVTAEIFELCRGRGNPSDVKFPEEIFGFWEPLPDEPDERISRDLFASRKTMKKLVLRRPA